MENLKNNNAVEYRFSKIKKKDITTFLYMLRSSKRSLK